MEVPVFSVSDFVAVLNQTLEYAYPSVVVQGELTNFRVSKNRWVYFDLKDETASVKFFGTVYSLPGPLEDGLVVQVRGTPRLHPLYGFSVTVQTIQPVGEGSLKRAAALLEAKLTAEGLFAPERKRMLPYPPKRIGLITSSESAAYHDFMKILNGRWGGVEVLLADVQVQGEAAPAQIVSALEHFNTHEEALDVIIVTRGGGSAEDLAAFSTESVTRAVAGSRIPTLVAIGHEVDISLAELAADQRASTPSNAAELLVPDRRSVQERLSSTGEQMYKGLIDRLQSQRRLLTEAGGLLEYQCQQIIAGAKRELSLKQSVLTAYNPTAALRRGYAIVRSNGEVVKSIESLHKNQKISINMHDGAIDAKII